MRVAHDLDEDEKGDEKGNVKGFRRADETCRSWRKKKADEWGASPPHAPFLCVCRNGEKGAMRRTTD